MCLEGRLEATYWVLSSLRTLRIGAEGTEGRRPLKVSRESLRVEEELRLGLSP